MEAPKTLYIMRGVPGSGKSTLANQLAEGDESRILSTDQFFMKDGTYQFDGKMLGKAHEWNQKRAFEAMAKGVTPIIIDNTNLQAWEAAPYVKEGTKHGYRIEIKEPDTPWKRDAAELHKRGQHNVPLEAIQRMLERFEEYTVEDALKATPPIRQPRPAPSAAAPKVEEKEQEGVSVKLIPEEKKEAPSAVPFVVIGVSVVAVGVAVWWLYKNKKLPYFN